MHVGVMNARHCHAALKIDNLGVVANIGADLIVRTDGNDDPVVYRSGVRPTALTINGINAAIEKNQIGRGPLRLFCAGSQK